MRIPIFIGPISYASNDDAWHCIVYDYQFLDESIAELVYFVLPSWPRFASHENVFEMASWKKLFLLVKFASKKKYIYTSILTIFDEQQNQLQDLPTIILFFLFWIIGCVYGAMEDLRERSIYLFQPLQFKLLIY